MARGRLVRLFTEDLGTKVLALVIALVLWGAVSFLGTRTLVVSDVPVGTINLREDLALAAPLEAVDVKLRAPRALLRGRDPQGLARAFVDLAGRGLGAQAAEVAVSPADPRVDVVLVTPERISFALDPVVQRSLPVTVVPEGSPAEGYRVGEATIDPTTVQVRGSLGKLQQTQAIDVKVPVNGATTAIEGEYGFTPPEGVTVLTERVHVKLVITQAEETKTLGVRVVTVGLPAAGYWIRSLAADPPVVTVRGPRETLGDRTFIETAPVNVDEARNSVTRAVDLALGSGVTVVGGPPRVQVKVEVVPLEGSKEVSAAVQVSDVPDGLRVTTVSPGTVRVTVRGSGEAFDRLRDEDVRVLLSASGKSAGTFSARPSAEAVRAPSGIQIVSVEGVDVSVSLEGS